MEKINVLQMLKERKQMEEIKKTEAYLESEKKKQEEIDMCYNFVLPVLRKYITDKTKNPLFVECLNKVFDDYGFLREDLSEYDKRIQEIVCKKCYEYGVIYKEIICSNLSVTTKIDIIVKDILNSDIEDYLFKQLNNK